MEEVYLIVGLGNPGKEYEYTRHNLGFLVVQKLAEDLKLSFKTSRHCNSLIAHGFIEKKKVYLALPLTFVNNSGAAVKKIVEEKKVALEDTLIVCDDLNLDFGQLRLRKHGSDGGHNGLDSIITSLGSKDFARLRLGIGSPQHSDTVDFVLGEFSKGEKKLLGEFIKQSSHCCYSWLKEGITQAMDQFNRRKEYE